MIKDKNADWNIENWDPKEEIMIAAVLSVIDICKEEKLGVNGLTIAQIKAEGMILAQTLTHLYNTCLKNGKLS